ncbi:hypothetical protein F4819DRAFT_5804 [Hypoxylon fuscum]|nr:hypothetical protein F4819DRAFT_5804 [Hypoxylon fuscum]
MQMDAAWMDVHYRGVPGPPSATNATSATTAGRLGICAGELSFYLVASTYFDRRLLLSLLPLSSPIVSISHLILPYITYLLPYLCSKVSVLISAVIIIEFIYICLATIAPLSLITSTYMYDFALVPQLWLAYHKRREAPLDLL